MGNVHRLRHQNVLGYPTMPSDAPTSGCTWHTRALVGWGTRACVSLTDLHMLATRPAPQTTLVASHGCLGREDDACNLHT